MGNALGYFIQQNVAQQYVVLKIETVYKEYSKHQINLFQNVLYLWDDIMYHQKGLLVGERKIPFV